MADEQVLYLIRHGVAAERGPDYPDDSKRPLTAEGKAKMREIGAGLVRADVEFDEILTSPFVRTRQTADLLAGAWSKAPQIVELPELAVGGRSTDVFAALASRDGGRQLALVGHMPGIGLLAAELIGCSHAMDFKKGAVACVTLNKTPARGAGQL